MIFGWTNIWCLPYCEYSYIVIFGWTSIWGLPYCDYVNTFHGWVTWGAILTSYFLYDIVETMLCVHPLFPFPGKAGDDIFQPSLWFSWDHVTKFWLMGMQGEVTQPSSALGLLHSLTLPSRKLERRALRWWHCKMEGGWAPESPPGGGLPTSFSLWHGWDINLCVLSRWDFKMGLLWQLPFNT